MLRGRQQRFVEEYLVDLNAAEAVRRAGYRTKYPGKVGYLLLEDPRIAAAINQAKLAQSQRTAITADRVLLEAARLAFLDPRKLFDTDGKMLPPSAWDDDTAAAIAGLEISEQYDWIDGQKVPSGQLKKIRLWSKPENLTLLAKHLRLLQEESKDQTINIQINVNTSLAEALQRAYSS